MKPQLPVAIIGGGPVGMTLGLLLNKMKVPNFIVERSAQIQTHPKAHFLSFRTCEILKDIGIEKGLTDKFDTLEYWKRFRYQTHVIDGINYGEVN